MLHDSHALVVPDRTVVVRKGMFQRTAYEQVFIPRNVMEIQQGSFRDWKNLKKVVFEEGSVLKKIGERAFDSCCKLNSIELPNNLTEIGQNAFCSSGLENFKAPKSLRIICQSAFQNCLQLKRVQLNEGLDTLGTDEYPDGKYRCGVFEDCALESIYLPSTLKRIEYRVFMKCKNLKRV